MPGKTLALRRTLVALFVIFANLYLAAGGQSAWGQKSPDPFDDPPPQATDDPFGNADPFGNRADDPFGNPAPDPFGKGDPFRQAPIDQQDRQDNAPLNVIEQLPRRSTGNSEGLHEPSPAVLQALDKNIEFAFVEVPLGDVAKYLGNAAKVAFHVDTLELENAGLGVDTPVTLNLKGVSLRSALRVMLRHLDLTYLASGERILITTPEAVEANLYTRVLPVRDLAVVRGEDDRLVEDDESLSELIMATISPNTWDEVGGPGSIQSFQGSMIISQSLNELDQIANLFDTLRKIPAIEGGPPNAPALPRILLNVESEAARGKYDAIEKKLDEPIKFQCPHTPLGDVIALLSERHGLPMLLDHRALDNAGLSADTPVAIQSKHASLRQGLRLMLLEIGLTFILRDEVVLITTPEETEAHLEVAVYPVADLLDVGDEFASVGGQLDDLIHAIVSTVRPDSWDQVGGTGSLVAFPQRGALVCSQTQDVFAALDALLVKLRAVRKEIQQLPAGPAADRRALVTRTYHLIPSRGTLTEEKLADVVRIVQRTITPLEWTDEAGAPLVHNFNARLVVHHRPAVQRRVERLLREMGVLQPNSGGGGVGGGFF